MKTRKMQKNEDEDDYQVRKRAKASHFRIQQKDKVEKKVELIFKDAQNNNYNSLTIWGTDLDVERTIGVVEELKRIYVKQGKSYSQETSIKLADNNEPHLQVILTMLDTNTNDDTTNCDNDFIASNNN